MANYCITLDVTMSGDIYVEADSKEEAIKKAKERTYFGQDLSSFHCIDKEIVECEEDACS